MCVCVMHTPITRLSSNNLPNFHPNGKFPARYMKCEINLSLHEVKFKTRVVIYYSVLYRTRRDSVFTHLRRSDYAI